MRLETFLVRIWTGSDSDGDSMSTTRQPDAEEPGDEGHSSDPPPVAIRGLVRHVRSGSQSTFASEADLIAILRTSAARVAAATPGPAQDVQVEPVAIGEGQ